MIYFPCLSGIFLATACYFFSWKRLFTIIISFNRQKCLNFSISVKSPFYCLIACYYASVQASCSLLLLMLLLFYFLLSLSVPLYFFNRRLIKKIKGKLRTEGSKSKSYLIASQLLLLSRIF